MRSATLLYLADSGSAASSGAGAGDPPAETAAAPRTRTDTAAAGVGSDVRCLVVDDDPGVRSLMQHWLEDLGIEVRMLASAAEVQALTAREAFDLIVTDVVMDGMDGIELMRSLRKDARRPKVIGISGVPGSENLGRVMLTLGAEGFLLKPFRREELVAAMEKALGRKLSAA